MNFEFEVPMGKAEVQNPIDPTTGAKNQYRDVIAQTVFSINRNSRLTALSTLVAVEVSTTASHLDATWSLLSEEAINAAASAANLAPVIVLTILEDKSSTHRSLQ